MTDYIINMFLGTAGFTVLLFMNTVIVYKIFSHKDKFTGTLSKLYHNLGTFFMVLFFLQLLFPLYLIHLNFLRVFGIVPLPDISIIFLERIYLGIFILISIITFYIAAKLLDNMDKLVGMFSFSNEKKPKEIKLRDLYFTSKEKK